MSDPQNKKSLSVIIPVFNAGSTIGDLLSSVKPQLTEKIEVICVDDSSSDDSVLQIKKFPWARLCQRKERGGAGAARNSGNELAGGELLLFLDADTKITDNKLFDRFQEKYEENGNYVAWAGFYAQKNDGAGLFQRFQDAYNYVLSCNAMNRELVGDLPGSIFGIKKEVFEEMGGFNEDPGLHIDDNDLGYRLGKAGYKIWADGELRVRHRQPAFRHFVRDVFLRTSSYVQLIKKYKKFDNFMGTPKEGFSYAIAFLTLCTLGMIMLGKWLWPVNIALFFLVLFLQRKLIGAFSRTNGLFFVPIGIFFYFLISIPVTLGGFWGLLKRSYA